MKFFLFLIFLLIPTLVIAAPRVQIEKGADATCVLSALDQIPAEYSSSTNLIVIHDQAPKQKGLQVIRGLAWLATRRIDLYVQTLPCAEQQYVLKHEIGHLYAFQHKISLDEETADNLAVIMTNQK